jgi:F0F1-type ATP synthase membrane subunit b/b'
VYKEVINKDVSGDLNDVRKLIEDLREEMKTISKNQGKTIDNDSLAKLPQVMTELKNESVDEYEALIKSKTNDALSQIEKAYDQIRRSLSSMNGQTQSMPSDEIIAKLVGDNLAMKEQNQTFNELIDDLQRQIDEKNA